MSRIRIVVADQAEAIFYDTASLARAPKEVDRLSDPAAHLHEREFSSDRPGRSNANVGRARFALGPEPRMRTLEATRFARRIARRLDEGRRKEEFDDLIIVAGARFLSVMHDELSKATTARVVCEIPKDLVHSPVAELRRRLPQTNEELVRT